MPCVVSTACATQDGATEGIAVAVGVADKYVPVRERHIQRRVCAALLPRSRWCHCVRRRGWNAARATTTAVFRELAAAYEPLCCSSVGGGGPAARACTVGVTGCWCGALLIGRSLAWLCACVCALEQESVCAGVQPVTEEFGCSRVAEEPWSGRGCVRWRQCRRRLCTPPRRRWYDA